MTIDRTLATVRPSRSATLVTAVALLTLALAGCESANILPSLGVQPETTVASPVAAQPKALRQRVAVYPVVAAPDPLHKQLQADVAAAIDPARFAVIVVSDATTPEAEFQLRGFANAARDKQGVARFAYYFDVLDGAGQKVTRINGEQPLPSVGPKDKDIWAGVSPDIAKAAAVRTAAMFATAAASRPAAAPAVAGAGTAPATVAAITPSAADRVATAGSETTTRAVAQTTAPSTTAALTPPAAAPPKAPAGPVTVAVPAVSGAPGDGSKSLTAALRTELKKQGLTVVEGKTPATYRVEGKVRTEVSEAGAEKISIEWVVADGRGAMVAKVSQANTIEKGSLDGPWGPTAGHIAEAASTAILQLLKKPDAASATPPGRQAGLSGAAPVGQVY